jgi:PKD repeat protein
MRKLYNCYIIFLLINTFSASAFYGDKSNIGYEDFKYLATPPNVNFSFTSDGSCSGTPIIFTSTVSGIAPFKYSWDFGDGTTSTDSNPKHVFNATGCGSQNFTVKLTVTDKNGEVNSVTKTVAVKQKPDLKFTNLMW